MTDFPTRDDLFNAGANEVLSRNQVRTTGRQITAEQIFTQGSDANLLLAAGSVMGEEVVRGNSRAISDLTIDGASGLALDRLAADMTGGIVVRKQAAPSRGSLQLSRTSIAAGAVNYDSGSIVQTQDGTRFRLLQTASLGATSFGPVSVDARAVDAGIGGNVDANTITSAVTAFPDATMSVTNPLFFSGGDDVESDASLRARLKRFFLAARRGVLAAIEFGALTVDGVRQAAVEEELDSNSRPTGFISLYIADANGQANAQLLELVRVALLEYRGGGIVVDLFGAIPTLVPVTLRLQYESNIDTLAAFEQVQDNIIARVNELEPNATLERSLLFEAARAVTGVIVLNDAIVAPTGDVVPSDGEVLRTRRDIVIAEVS